MKKIFSLFMVLITLPILSFAQNELSFEFDYAKFNYDSTSVLEFYYELNPKNMQVFSSDKNQMIEAIVHIEMKNLITNEFFIKKDWKVQDFVATTGNDSVPKLLSGVLRFEVPIAKYSFLVKVGDSKNQNFSKTINETLLVEPVKLDKFSISDIELANNIKTEDVDPNSLFYKNTLEVMANPAMLYTNASPVMFYYAELYNLILEKKETVFSLQKILYNSSGLPVYQKTKNIKQSKDAIIEYDVVNLSKYPTDSYNFVLSLIDPATNQAYVSSKRFYFYNPNVKDTSRSSKVNSGILGSEFGIFTKDECDKMFLQVKYIASDREISQYKSFDSLKAKREFLYEFWRNRDTDPSTPQNEFKEEYMKRVAYANKNFTSMIREGFLTDRGRVALLYGEPDQRDFYPSDSEVKPYEVWFYNEIEGGVSFIFGDVTGFGNYELLHSTKRGEVKDENWIRRISSK
ncbi:MAG: GWxTD domain-containing protein [Ignavibacteriales bacterium]|nr:MAG: GWxTD domain-containing protein [Ignavibacteriales bacterium]